MSAPLRLLYSSNAFWCTSGYGVQGKSLLMRLAELPEFGGYPGRVDGRQNIAQFAWYGQEGGVDEKYGFRVYPRFDDPYGNDVIGAHAQHFGANLVITLIDIFVLRNTAAQVAPALWCPWLPIDTDPVPEIFLECLAGAHMPLTYSQWGHKMLAGAGVKNEYIPHGIEPNDYHVIPEREEVRKFKRWLTSSDDCHLSVMVAANKGFPDRKWFQGQIEAWRDFKKDKDNCKLYIHSLPTPVHGGIDFATLAKRLGIEGQLIFPHPYLYRLGYPPEHLRLVYNAADVMLAASMSEGFGIPIIEAQACGCPVVTTDFSAMPELLHWGHLVEVDDMVMTGMHSYQAWPSKRDMTKKLNNLYDSWLLCGKEWPLEKRIATQNAIHAKYDWNAIVRDQWAPFMARMAQEAPNPDQRFHAAGAPPPQALRDDVSSFVDEVNAGLALDAPVPKVKDAPRVPRRRTEPFVVEPKLVSYTSEEVKQLPDESDWAAADAMTDEEIKAAIASDPDENLRSLDWTRRGRVVPRDNGYDREAVTINVGSA